MTRTVPALAIIALCASPAAADERLPAKQRTLLIFKSLTYDTNISKGRDMLRVGVITRKGNNDSDKVGKEMEAQIRAIQNMKVSGMKISAELLAADAVAAALKMIEDKKVNVLYLAPGVEGMLASICDVAQKKKILVVSGEADHAKKCSALTFVLRDGKPKILLNVKSAGVQGAAFKSEFLKVAETVR